MKYLFTILALTFILTTKAQIIATTDGGGKKVILNLDGTWKYMDGSQPLADCVTNKTGKLTVYNTTSHDMYFYYGENWATGSAIKYIMVKANSSRTIDNLNSHAPSGNGGYLYKYLWVASYEMLSYRDYESINNYKGFEKGDFQITDCQNTDLKVGG